MENVVVLGASSKPERYSNKAVTLLTEQGYKVIPVHPAIKEVNGIDVVATLKDIDMEVDTVCLYVNGTMVEKMIDDIINLKPRRVIFSPGTESSAANKILDEKGIETLNACTLVLLKTNQF